MFVYIDKEIWTVMYTLQCGYLRWGGWILIHVVYQLQKHSLNWSCGAHLENFDIHIMSMSF